MNKILLFGFACAIGALSTPAWCVPGEVWELNKTVTMLGKVMPAPMIKLCLPKGADAQSAQRALKNDDCRISDVKTSGNKTTWKVSCEQDGKIDTGFGESVGDANKSEGVMHFSDKSGGRNIDITHTHKLKRMGGACNTDDSSF